MTVLFLDSDLAKLIAAYKTTPNRFAALTKHPDTAAAVHTRVPLFAPEIRAAVIGGLEAADKQAARGAPPNAKAAWQEFFKGLTRTVKDKELDVCLAFRGPDKDGWFTLLGVTAFDDPAESVSAAPGSSIFP